MITVQIVDIVNGLRPPAYEYSFSTHTKAFKFYSSLKHSLIRSQYKVHILNFYKENSRV